METDYLEEEFSHTGINESLVRLLSESYQLMSRTDANPNRVDTSYDTTLKQSGVTPESGRSLLRFVFYKTWADLVGLGISLFI